jgi:hypothetical protein
MLELDGIVAFRRPDGTRWNDGALFRFTVRLVERESGLEYVEEARVEDLQSYPAFQAYVAREFGLWYRYVPAENPSAGPLAWSEYLALHWGRDWSADTALDPGSGDAYFDTDTQPD